MREISVFFLRGLSTKGGDDIRFAFMNWGMMYTHLQRELGQRGVTIHPVIGMGSGTFDDQASIALEYLRSHPQWTNSGAKVHLLGHSAGGLIAKNILNRLTPAERDSKIASLVTIATPHRGSKLAELCLTAPERNPRAVWLLRRIGYDVRNGFSFYEQLTSQSVNEKFADWQTPPHVQVASVICSAGRRTRSWPFWLARLLPTMRQIPLPSDGLLEKESQTFGQVLGDYELDHLCQLGVYNKPEFKKMCDTLATFFSDVQSRVRPL